jgi:hypothetical protein
MGLGAIIGVDDYLRSREDQSLLGTAVAGCSLSEGRATGKVLRSPASRKQNMRAPLSPLLLATAWVSAAWLAGAGCASAPEEEASVASKERACSNDASDPLHMASSRPNAERDRDPRIESILNQQPADPRLAWVNRQMYQALHALDVELRREQRIAACEHPELSSPTLEAQSSSGSAAGGGASAGAGVGSPGGSAAMGSGGGGAEGGAVPAAGGGEPSGDGTGLSGGGVSVAATATSGGVAPPANAGSAGTPPPAASKDSIATAAPSAARSTLIRKASLSATGGGGNGATAPKLNPASDNDIVAGRLRKAAEQETNPTLRAKLWKEYAEYRQGLAAK